MVNNNKGKKLSFKTKIRQFRRGMSTNRRRVVLSKSKDHNTIGYMKLVRMILTSLPIDGLSDLTTLFDVAFDYIAKVLSTKTYNVGSYCMFTLSPADLLYNSPLLAQNGSNFTFPGYPVSVKWISLKLICTTQNSERSGRWAAVLIPYRELHDASHYKQVLNSLTYDEVAAMPHSKSAPVRQNITLTFTMRDKTMYCARPREISEDIAVVLVVWDTGARSTFTSLPDNTVFNCEIAAQGGILPHPIFGPRHRVSYNASIFAINSITKGNQKRIHYEDGRIEFEELIANDFERLEIDNVN